MDLVSNSFRSPQLRAARSWIPIDLFCSSRHRLLGEQSIVALPHSVAEGVFHNAVLQRVKADDHQPSARFQQLRGGVQQLPQVVQFMVYEDSECLKSLGRWMNPSFCLIHWPGRG